MKHTHKKIRHKRKPHIVFPLFIIFLLLLGIAISLVQLQYQQDVRQRAASPSGSIIQNCNVADAQMASSAAEQEMFNQINVYRQEQGLKSLTWSPLLKKAATWMSDDMLVNEKLTHVDSLNRDFATRIAECGFQSPAVFGENIDNGTTDVPALLTSWKHSLPHNTNLLNSNFTEAGVALATGSAVTQSYWTVNFAGASISASITLAPSPSASVSPSINPSATPSASVSKSPSVTPTKGVSPVVTKKPTQPIPPTEKYTPTITPTPTIYPGYVLNPLDTQLLVTAKIPSIGNGGNKNPKIKDRPVEVIVYDSANREVTKKSGKLTYNGNLFAGVIHLGTVANGTYYVRVISPLTLQAIVQPQFQVLRNDRLNVLPLVTLVQGDINSNNELTLEDYNLALACFQNKPCVTKSLVDFNDDGKANVTDYNILLQNFWEFRGD